MTRRVTLDARQRRALLDRYRKVPRLEVRFRAHILLLLADGRTWEEVAAALYCSSRTIDRLVTPFQEEGTEAIAGRKLDRPFRVDPECRAVVTHGVTTKLPTDFGFPRSP